MADVRWLTSGWDHNVHAFRELTDVASEALCSHSALTGKLTEPAVGERQCVACLLIFGGDLADRQGHERDRWAQ